MPQGNAAPPHHPQTPQDLAFLPRNQATAANPGPQCLGLFVLGGPGEWCPLLVTLSGKEDPLLSAWVALGRVSCSDWDALCSLDVSPLSLSPPSQPLVPTMPTQAG